MLKLLQSQKGLGDEEVIRKLDKEIVLLMELEDIKW